VLPDFDSMNETDVREIIVRPLLTRLGFAHGTQANIRTEVTLRYDKAFLGRKDPKRDPPLAGRADYICEAISYGRWAVEVKAPNHQLTRDDAEQAHTYCAHPEISASHFLLTNGRIFQLYATGELDKPLLEWSFQETDQHMVTLFNVLGYQAIRKRAGLLKVDVSKPLGLGLGPKLAIVGGEVRYKEHRSDHPLLAGHVVDGASGAVTGGTVERLPDGRIQATVSLRSPFQQFDDLNRMAGIGDYVFLTSDEYISSDPERPTILQNVLEGRLEPGARFRPMPGFPEIELPIGFQFVVYTEATGYVAEDRFVGVLTFDYDYQFIRGRPTGNPMIDRLLFQTPPTAKLVGSGEFTIITK
jgi:hypothetical protein